MPDREIGAAAGSGTSHILFVVPRSALTEAARRGILVRSALTPLHIFALARDDLAEKNGEALLARLRKQERLLAEVKRREALTDATTRSGRAAFSRRRCTLVYSKHTEIPEMVRLNMSINGRLLSSYLGARSASRPAHERPG